MAQKAQPAVVAPVSPGAGEPSGLGGTAGQVPLDQGRGEDKGKSEGGGTVEGEGRQYVHSYGELNIDKTADGAEPPECPEWLRLKSIKYLVMNNDSSDSTDNVLNFMFKQDLYGDNMTKAKPIGWRLSLPTAFLEASDTTSNHDDFHDEAWYSETLDGLVKRQDAYETLKNKTHANADDAPGGCLDGLYCCSKAPLSHEDIQNEKERHKRAKADQSIRRLLSIKQKPEGKESSSSDKDVVDKNVVKADQSIRRRLSIFQKPEGKESPSSDKNVVEDNVVEEYARRLQEALRALGETMASRCTWVDVGDGRSSCLRLFLQMGLLAQWRAGKAPFPIVLAIRVLENETETELGKSSSVEQTIARAIKEDNASKDKLQQLQSEAQEKRAEKDKATDKLEQARGTNSTAVTRPVNEDGHEHPAALEGHPLEEEHADKDVTKKSEDPKTKELAGEVEKLAGEVKKLAGELDAKEAELETQAQQVKTSKQQLKNLRDLKMKMESTIKEVKFTCLDKSVDSSLLPCITHVIFVRSPSQMLDVRTKLKRFGSTINLVANGDNKTYYQLLSDARFGSMHLVLDKTGGAAQDLAWDVHCHTSEMIQVVPAQDELCEISVTGSGFPCHSFKVIDPLQALTKTRKFYEDLLAGLEEGDDNETNSSSQEKKRVQYVWEQIAIFRHNGKSFRCLGRLLTFLIVFLAFLTTFAAIESTRCQAKFSEYVRGFEDWADEKANFTDHVCGLTDGSYVTKASVQSNTMLKHYSELTILLPLLASIMFALISKLNPTEKWAHLESAATALESEIYLYRTRTRRYSKIQTEASVDQRLNKVRDAPVINDSKLVLEDSRNRQVVFADTVNKILEDALSSDMRNDYLVPSTMTSKAENVVLFDSRAEIRYANRSRCSWLLNCRCCGRKQALSQLGRPLMQEQHADGGFALKMKEEPNPGSAVPGLNDLEQDLWRGADADFKFTMEALDTDLASFRDDGVSELQPETYIQARFAPMLRAYNAKAERLGKLVKLSQVVMTMMTGCTTLFAAIQEVDLRPWVPVIVALNALIAQCSEYEKMPTRLTNVRKSIEQLTRLQVWWTGLKQSEQRKAANKFKLVERTEEQSDAEIAAWKKSSKVDETADDQDDKPDNGQTS